MENVRFPLLVYLALCLVISVLSQDQSALTVESQVDHRTQTTQRGLTTSQTHPLLKQESLNLSLSQLKDSFRT
ncbi:hypothetical protein YC2023_097492 [Brassica napus]